MKVNKIIMKKRVNKIYKHRMFILLATLNLVWAGVITGIVLRLKSKDYSKHNILKEYYSFDKNGNLILKGYLKPHDNTNYVFGIFSDESNQEHKIQALVNDKKEFEFNTKLLPLNHSYKLKKVISTNDYNHVLLTNDALVSQQKICFSKPVDAKVNFINNKKVYQVQLNTLLKNTLIQLTLKDLQHNVYKITAKSNDMAEVNFDVSQLKNNNLYEVIALEKQDQTKIVNVNEIEYNNKIINNLNIDELNTPYQYSKNGNLNLIAKIPVRYANEQVYGVFEDQNKQKHLISAVNKNDGTIMFDTQVLTKDPNKKYHLQKVVLAKNQNQILIHNFDLVNNQKQDIFLKEYKVISISALENDADKTKREINLKLSNIKNDWVNKQIKVIYSSSDGSDVQTQPLVLEKNQTNYVLKLNNLKANRLYTLKAVELINNNDKINLPLDTNLTNRFIVKRTSAVLATSISEISNRLGTALTNAQVKITLKDVDNVLLANQKAIINYDNNQKSEATVVINNGVKYLIATLTKLTLNTPTIIKSITFEQKPTCAIENIGLDKTNNIIYQNTHETAIPLVIDNNFEINGPLASSHESLKNINASDAKKVNAINLTLDFNTNEHIYKNLFFKLKYVPIDNQGNENIYDASEAIYSDVLSANNIVANKIQFSLGNLQTNRKYKLKTIYYLTSKTAPLDDHNVVMIKPNVKSEIIVAPNDSMIVKYGNWNQDSITNGSKAIFKINCNDGDILSEDLSATLVYESNDPHDLQSYTTKLKKVNNDWVIDFNLNNLKPQTTYHLKSITIAKPNKAYTNLKIQSLPQVDIKTQLPNLILHDLKATSAVLKWDSTNNGKNNHQTIQATFSHVSANYDNLNVKLIYEYNYRGDIKTVESDLVTLKKDQDIYQINLPISIPNRKYIFKRILIQERNNLNNYVDLNKKINLTDSFVVSPGKTTFEWTQPTGDQISQTTLKSLKIKILSEDKTLDNNVKVIVWFKSHTDSNDALKWTRGTWEVNSDGSEAIINQLNNLSGFKAGTQYYLYKIAFVDNLQYGNAQANDNKVIYEWKANDTKEYKFTTKSAPTVLESIKFDHCDADGVINSGDEGIAEFSMTTNKVNDDFANRKVKFIYHDNNNVAYETDGFPLSRSETSLHFSLWNIPNNREYTFDHAEIETSPNSNKYEIWHSQNKIISKFKLKPAQTSIKYIDKQERNNNNVDFELHLGSRDCAFENKQKYRVTLVSVDALQTEISKEFLLSDVKSDYQDGNIGILKCHFDNLTPNTAYTLKEIKFLANSNEQQSAKPNKVIKPFNDDNNIIIDKNYSWKWVIYAS